MNLARKKLTIMFIFLLLISLSFAITWMLIPKEQQLNYNIFVEVGDVTTLNPTPDLNFGKLKPGESATKSINFKNNFLSFVKLELSAIGSVSELLSFEKNMTIFPLSSKNIKITIIIPENVAKGKYSGEIMMNAKRYLR